MALQSKGQAELDVIVRSLLPNENIIYEHHVGEKLRLDIYVPSYSLGIEFHGRQHFYFNTHYFDTIEDFKLAQARDERKIELCKELGIGLAVFDYTDKLTSDLVFERINEALDAPPPPEEDKTSRYVGNEYYEARKQADRERRKQQYKEMKRKRDST